ncbi:hypothetical protein L873DRAFT_275201 [Choiromyces venosus 120613-1]|uniref:Uncharacterized protein n=1 Tax=Choiromyces venosus 120613-1 TaxID=1336337 RepID=A0A3N4K1H7_9PEZI|nr:hypothetical protein L873DRAFT_275201 [Choiromyces venosus 120613-1]
MWVTVPSFGGMGVLAWMKGGYSRPQKEAPCFSAAPRNNNTGTASPFSFPGSKQEAAAAAAAAAGGGGGAAAAAGRQEGGTSEKVRQVNYCGACIFSFFYISLLSRAFLKKAYFASNCYFLPSLTDSLGGISFSLLFVVFPH